MFLTQEIKLKRAASSYYLYPSATWYDITVQTGRPALVSGFGSGDVMTGWLLPVISWAASDILKLVIADAAVRTVIAGFWVKYFMEWNDMEDRFPVSLHQWSYGSSRKMLNDLRPRFIQPTLAILSPSAHIDKAKKIL